MLPKAAYSKLLTENCSKMHWILKIIDLQQDKIYGKKFSS